MIKLPTFLNIPEKLLPIITEYNNYAYALCEGGRGGGKSQAIARFLLYLGEKYKLRICCGRETMNSIDESVYTVLKDIILDYNLNYDILATKLTHRESGTTFIFKGFREQGRVSIKGLEAVSILYIDESQSITKSTLEVIIPTIRKEKSKVFFAMNRYKKNDAVYTEFVNRKDCLHIKINYMDNPFCPKKLIHEAEESKAKGEDASYRHVWLGEPLDDVDNYLFTGSNLENCQHAEFFHNEALYGYRIGGFDLARMGNDRCAFVVLEQKGPVQWEEIYTETWKKKDLAHTTGRMIDRIGKFKLDISIVDGDGLGAGPRDIADFFINSPKSIVEWRANHTSPDDIKATTGQKRVTRRHKNIKSWAWHQVKDMIENNWLKINNKDILTDMETVLYDFMPDGTRFIVSKDDMRSREKMKQMGISSPDAGEALMMAVSEIRNIDKVYDQNKSNLPNYAVMDNELTNQVLPKYAGM